MNNFKKVILSIILIISTGTSCFSYVFAKAEQHLNYAYAILGDILQTEGMKVVVGSGVNPEIRKELNRVGYVLDPSKEASSYLDIDIDDRIAKNLDDGTNFEVAVDYFDSSMLSSLSLRYPKYKNNNDWNFLSELSAVEKMINEAEILELRGAL